MDYKISVVIPTYKRSGTLGRAIESVLRQTYKNIEIIVVDDNGLGTPDQAATEKFVKDNYPTVIYIAHEKNKGGSAARNTGWKSSVGDYISFLDDDDEMLPEKMEKQLSLMLRENVNISYTAYKILKQNGRTENSTADFSGNVYIRTLMRTMYVCGGSNLLVKRNAVEETGGFDESFKRNQDLEFLVRLCEKNDIGYLGENLLVIHTEVRENQPSYESVNNTALFYLEKFKDKINALSPRDRKRVMAVISLDRARAAVKYKLFGEAFAILRENNVNPVYTVKYIFYMLKRKITKKSYGFYVK